MADKLSNTLSDHIANLLNWNFQEEKTGTGTVTLHANAKEYLFLLKYGNNSGEQALGFEWTLPASETTNKTHTLTSGYELSASSYCFAQIQIQNGVVQITGLTINGTDLKSTSILRIYYR